MSYIIQIDEAQRVALLRLIKESKVLDQDLEYFEEMLAELPEIEQEEPGIIHGFCL